jgi:uncharacterized membrane protein
MLTGSLLNLAAALVAFVGLHFLFSHPLRQPIVRIIGEKPFRGVYALTALVTFIWIILAFRAAPYVALWPQLEGLRWPVNIVMICASILVVGGFVAPNPFIQAMGPGLSDAPRVKGVFLLTRHPFMWGVALWAASHAAINGDARTVLLTTGMAILALAGAALQDAKLEHRLGGTWRDFEAHTSFVPFGAVLAGKARLADIGIKPLVAGLILYALLAGGHPHFIGVRALPFF